MADYIETPTMGEILNEEFFIPLGLSAYKVAKEINVPTSRIQDILHIFYLQSILSFVRIHFKA